MGQYLKLIGLDEFVDAQFPVRSGVANGDIIRTAIALLCMGKSDFEAAEGLRGDADAQRMLGLDAAPSSATLRQRLDGGSWSRSLTKLKNSDFRD